MLKKLEDTLVRELLNFLLYLKVLYRVSQYNCCHFEYLRKKESLYES